MRTIKRLQISFKTKVAGCLFQGAARTYNSYEVIISVVRNSLERRSLSPNAVQDWMAEAISDTSGLDVLACSEPKKIATKDMESEPSPCAVKKTRTRRVANRSNVRQTQHLASF